MWDYSGIKVLLQIKSQHLCSLAGSTEKLENMSEVCPTTFYAFFAYSRSTKNLILFNLPYLRPEHKEQTSPYRHHYSKTPSCAGDQLSTPLCSHNRLRSTWWYMWNSHNKRPSHISRHTEWLKLSQSPLNISCDRELWPFQLFGREFNEIIDVRPESSPQIFVIYAFPETRNSLFVFFFSMGQTPLVYNSSFFQQNSIPRWTEQLLTSSFAASRCIIFRHKQHKMNK